MQRIRERSQASMSGGVQQPALVQIIAAELQRHQRQRPLTRGDLEALSDVEAREAVLGDRLYSLVVLSGRAHRPGKVTGMLLEGLDASDLAEILVTSPDGAATLVSWIEEACQVLGEKSTAQRAPAADAPPPPPPLRLPEDEWQVVTSRSTKRRGRASPDRACDVPHRRGRSCSTESAVSASSDGSWA